MAQFDGSIRINTAIDKKGFESGAKSLTEDMKRLGNTLNGIAKSLCIGFGIAELVKMGKQAVSTASDIEEVQNVVDTAFGSMSYKAEEFADTAIKKFGISKLAAKQMSSTFAAMGVSMVGDLGQATDMAIELSKRSADMASFFNKSVSETSTALKAVFTGETEVLKQYGVIMTEVNLQEYAATLGIKKKVSAMTQAEKVQLRYNYIMQQTSLAAGDFEKTSGSWANQTRILSEQFKQLLSVLGGGLVTVLTPAVKILNKMLTELIAIAEQLGAVLSKLFGITVPVASTEKGFAKIAGELASASDGAGGLADGMEEAGKAAKKSLAAFDNLNVLNDGKDDSGGAAAIEIPTIDMGEAEKTESAIDGISEKLQPIIDKLKELKKTFNKSFAISFGDSEERIQSIKDSLSSIKEKLIEIWSDPEVSASSSGYADSVALVLGSLSGMVSSIGLTIATNLLGGFSKYLEENSDRIKEYLVSMFDIWSDVNSLLSELFESISYVFEAFASDSGQQLTANIIGIFTDSFMGLTEVVSKLVADILNIIIQPFTENAEGFRTALEGFLGVLSEVTGTIKDSIDETFSTINKVYDEHLKPFFDSIAEGLSLLTEKFLEFWNTNVQPLLDEMAADFDELWKSYVQPVINKAIEIFGKLSDLLKAIWDNVLVPLIGWIIENVLPNVLPVIKALWKGVKGTYENITKVIDGLLDIVGGIIDFLAGVFSGDWKKAWNGIKRIVVGIFKTIWNTIETIASAIATVITTVLTAIVAFWKTKWKAIRDFVGKIWEAIGGKVESAITVLHDTISNVIGAVKKTWNKIWNAIKNKAVSIWDAISNTVTTVIDAVKTTISTAIENIKSTWDTGLGAIKDTAKSIWKAVKKTFSSAWDKIKEIFSGVGDFFGGIWDGITGAFGNITGWFKKKFSKAWQAVKDVFSSGGEVFDGIKDGILSGLKSVINALISDINTIISVPFNGLNKALKKIKDISVLGENPFSFIKEISVPEIPKLASGAVIRGGDPFMAVLGDQRRGQTNIETPLPLMVKAFRQAMKDGGTGSGEVSVKVYLDGKDVTSSVKTQADSYFKRTGRPLFDY